ncbi:hypothetical protein [Streptomyces sp. NPDC060065]|uniref:hypothetical protein n=1 Tax=Streptomyces sp. NPDC060065 TaxID=3347050 RepID=UPI0036BD1572
MTIPRRDNVRRKGEREGTDVAPGTAHGAAVTALGLRVAAPRTARRLPEILTAVSRE